MSYLSSYLPCVLSLYHVIKVQSPCDKLQLLMILWHLQNGGVDFSLIKAVELIYSKSTIHPIQLCELQYTQRYCRFVFHCSYFHFLSHLQLFLSQMLNWEILNSNNVNDWPIKTTNLFLHILNAFDNYQQNIFAILKC
jgi:hypothetical protein